MHVKLQRGLVAIAIIIGTLSCGSVEQQYEKLVKKELAKGQRFDSLFLGIHFGMDAKVFYDSCWQMNKRGLLMDGTNNTMVLYKMKDQLKYPVSMNFYPDFYKGKIFHMRVNYKYDAWAPWNKYLYADSLMSKLMVLYKKQYPGNDFIKIKDKQNDDVFFKVDGNRRIIVGTPDDMSVNVDFTDLLVEEKLKKEVKIK